MKRFLVLACAVLLLAGTACGGGSQAAPTASPGATLQPGVVPPVDNAQNTVNQLNDVTQQREAPLQPEQQQPAQQNGNGYGGYAE